MKQRRKQNKLSQKDGNSILSYCILKRVFFYYPWETKFLNDDSNTLTLLNIKILPYLKYSRLQRHFNCNCNFGSCHCNQSPDFNYLLQGSFMSEINILVNRIHWRLSTILETIKKVYEVMFFDFKSMYILKVYLIHYTLT